MKRRHKTGLILGALLLAMAAGSALSSGAETFPSPPDKTAVKYTFTWWRADVHRSAGRQQPHHLGDRLPRRQCRTPGLLPKSEHHPGRRTGGPGPGPLRRGLQPGQWDDGRLQRRRRRQRQRWGFGVNRGGAAAAPRTCGRSPAMLREPFRRGCLSQPVVAAGGGDGSGAGALTRGYGGGGGCCGSPSGPLAGLNGESGQSGSRRALAEDTRALGNKLRRRDRRYSEWNPRRCVWPRRPRIITGFRLFRHRRWGRGWLVWRRRRRGRAAHEQRQ